MASSCSREMALCTGPIRVYASGGKMSSLSREKEEIPDAYRDEANFS